VISLKKKKYKVGHKKKSQPKIENFFAGEYFSLCLDVHFEEKRFFEFLN